MTAPAALPFAIDAALLAQAEEAAQWRGMTLGEFVHAVIGRAVEADLALAAKIQEGRDALDRGDSYTQDEMEAWFATRLGQAAAE